MKLLKHIIIRGVINSLTGLKIGGSKEQGDIGDLDNNIIRHPISGEPYIPGSSIKGKMRALLEYRHSENNRGTPCNCGSCKVCEYFGSLGRTKGPTRVLVRDANLTENSRDRLREAQIELGVNYAEVKTENMINRKTGIANPRQQERVPAGTEFEFEISIRHFDIDQKDDLVEFVLEGMELLQNDYLGGSGGRGYGQIQFQNVTIDGQLSNRFVSSENK